MTSSATSSSCRPRGEARRGRPGPEHLFAALVWGTGLLGLACMMMVVAVLVGGAWPALSEVGLLPFLTGLDWHPTAGSFSLVPMIAGTSAVSLGALALAGPLGVVCALYVRFYAGEAGAGAFRLVLQALAGIPSVIYGLWGLTVLVPFIAQLRPPGASLLSGIIVLAIMVLPTVAVVAEAALRQLPASLYMGGLGLGCPRHRVILGVVLPSARRPLVMAGVLGLARALGETMAVLMVTGNAIALPDSLFAPVRTLSANIALEMAYAFEVHRSALFVTGLVLMVLVLALLVACGRVGREAAHAE